MSRAITAITLGILRALLRFHPSRFRSAFAGDIEATVRRELDEAARHGAMPQLRAGMRALIDACAALFGARRARRRAPLALAQDARVAWRHLRAHRGTTITVAATLVCALAAAIAMFAVVEAALLRPLPFPDGQRLVRLEERTEGAGRPGVSVPAFDIWQRELTTLRGVAFYEPRESTVTVAGEPDRLAGAGVSRDFFAVLGVAPSMGRTFSPGPRFGPPDEAVISHRLFERLGGASGIVGATIAIDPHVFTVVGVMPRGFSYPMGAEYWVTSKGMGPLETERSLRFLDAIGRLAPDADLRALESELAIVDARNPANDRIGGAVHMAAFPLRDAYVGSARTAMRVALVAVALLLLVACCNVSALLLARVASRARELAVHRAMGASPYRIARQCALETLAIAVPAGIAGTLIASRMLRVLVALASGQVPGIGEVQINAAVALFAVAASVGSALAASVVPTVFAARIPALASLQARDGSASRGLLAALGGLVVAQVAMGFVVAVCAALLARSVERLVTAERGFDQARVAVARINFPIRTPAARAAQVPFFTEVVARSRALPGVTAAGVLSRLPMSAALASSDVNAAEDPRRATRAVLQSASPGALPAIGATFVAGSDFAEKAAPAPDVIINDELARIVFPQANAVGERITFKFMAGTMSARVTGVIRATRYNGLSGEMLPSITLDYRTFQFPMSLVVRTSEDADALLPALRGIVRGSDVTRRVTVDQLTTLDREVALVLARPRFFSAVMGAFSVVVLAIAAAGLFAVLSFWVGQRRRELGIRLALGAPVRGVVLGVTRRAVITVAAGIAMGAGAAMLVTRSMASMLFGVGRADPVSFAAAAALFMAIAAAASAIPARRAARVDPVSVLRSE